MEKNLNFLDRNEFNYSPSKEVVEALKNFDINKLCFYTRIYDEGKKSILSVFLSELYDIDETQVLLGYGGEDILKQAVHYFLTKEWLPEPYEAVCAENDKEYPLPFAKIQDADTTLIERMHLKYLGGVYIDVFPLDGVPTGRMAQRMHFAKYEFYKRVLYLIHRDPYKHGKGPSSWIPLLCRKLFTLTEVQKSIREVMTRYDFDKSDLICDYDDGMKGIMPKKILGAPTPVLFENEEVWGVQEYDTYLSQKYGDYMTIPKQSGQRQHNFHYLDLNKPYRDFEV